MTGSGFPRAVVVTLGQRAAYLCSNPGCRQLTIGPHSEENKSLISGEAAHICAEAEGGPRYDPRQQDAERNGIGNGIWLCTQCHTKIDKDTVLYTKEKLIEWRTQHERYISGEGWKPDLPTINISTIDGLTTNSNGKTVITSDDFATLKDHLFTIRNSNSVPLHNLRARLQFPEKIIGRAMKVPTGVLASFEGEDLGGWIVRSKSGKGGAEIYMPPKTSFSNCILEIDKLYPSMELVILMRSSGPTNPDPVKFPGEMSRALEFYLQGSFQYEWKSIFYRRNVILPINYDTRTREVTTTVIGEDADSLGVQLATIYKIV